MAQSGNKLFTYLAKKNNQRPDHPNGLVFTKKIVGHSERKWKKDGLLKYCNACAAICTYLHDHALSMFTCFLFVCLRKKRVNILSA